jgi:hypothetical protein
MAFNFAHQFILGDAGQQVEDSGWELKVLMGLE